MQINRQNISKYLHFSVICRNFSLFILYFGKIFSLHLQMSNFFRTFVADLKITIMASPVLKRYNTPEEKAAVFEKWIHLREEWEAHVRQREIELGIV